MSNELKLAVLIAAGHLALIQHKTVGNFTQELKTELIDLEAKGWIVKTEGSKDLQLTPSGETVLNEMLEVLNGHLSS